jgi:hypothetical protein
MNRMTSSRQRKDFHRLFTLDGYYYIDASLPDRGYEWQLKIGLTKYLFNSLILGSVDAIEVIDSNKNDKSSSVLLKWSGLKTSEGDELYHAVWQNTEGNFDFKPLLPFKMVYNTSDLNMKIMDSPNDLYDICEDEDGWILNASCTDKEYESLFLSNKIRNQNDHDVFCSLNTKAINDIK